MNELQIMVLDKGIETGKFETGMVTISTGGSHGCGLEEDGRIICWGGGIWKEITPKEEGFQSVSAGYGHSCAIRKEGTIACWGDNRFGQAMPPGGSHRPWRPPLKDLDQDDTLETVNSGHRSTCALTRKGIVHCWGHRESGRSHRFENDRMNDPNRRAREVCDEQVNSASACGPEWIYTEAELAEADRFIQISTGRDHVCALRRDGTGQCWGMSGRYRQPTDDGIISISSGKQHSCALQWDGTTLYWGVDVGRMQRLEERQSTDVSCRWNYFCTTREDGHTDCRGHKHWTPRIPPEERVTKVSTGKFHVCGLHQDGSAGCWTHIPDVDGHEPPPEGETFLKVSSGGEHVCGLREDGKAICWGRQQKGPSGIPRGRTLHRPKQRGIPHMRAAPRRSPHLLGTEAFLPKLTPTSIQVSWLGAMDPYTNGTSRGANP